MEEKYIIGKWYYVPRLHLDLYCIGKTYEGEYVFSIHNGIYDSLEKESDILYLEELELNDD